MSSSTDPTRPVVFHTSTPYVLPAQKFMIPSSWKRYQLSQLVNKALELVKPVPFDFLVRGEVLRGSLGEWCRERGVGEEETLEIEYIESVMPPQRVSSLPHEDWVSAVDGRLPGHLLTASYDGSLRVFTHSQELRHSAQIHSAPISSFDLVAVPASDSDSNSDPEATTFLVGTTSHDLTARLTRLTIPSDPQAQTQTTPLASLHLHTAPLTAIAADPSGTHVLTSSSDGLIGLWTTTIPDAHEVPDASAESGRVAKRRKVSAKSGEDVKRKAPVQVLKSHTSRVEDIIWMEGKKDGAVSCGWDSTVRTWDVESGVCTATVTAPEKPFLALSPSPASHKRAVLASSTDRTVTLYDLRAATTSTTSPAAASFSHPTLPSCLSVRRAAFDLTRARNGSEGEAEPSDHQFVSGAYDGLIRLWDLRSTKAPISAFRTEDGKKVLGVDWVGGLVAVGGEAGVQVWRVGGE